MEDTTVVWIRKRFAELERIREPWEKQWKLIAQYICPFRETQFMEAESGSKVATKVFNGTAIIAVDTLVNGFLGHVVSPSIPWFDLAYDTPELVSNERAGVYLEDLKEHFYALIRRSNFYAATHDYTWDSATVATATLFQTKDIVYNRYNFQVMHPMEVYVGRDKYGNVDTIFRKYEMNVKNIAAEFGKDKLSDNLKERLKHSPLDMVDVIHAIYPNSNVAWGELPKLGANKAFASVYMEYDCAEDQAPLSVGGFDRFPGRTWCWERSIRDDYGRSPAYKALYDVIPLNKLGRDMLNRSHMEVNPPMRAPWESRGRIKLVPGGINYYKNYAQERIEAIPYQGQYSIDREREAVIEQRIDEHFMKSFFLLLVGADKPMTATEILEKAAEKAVVIGPVCARLEADCLDPMLEEMFEAEYEAGTLPVPPPEIEDMGGARIKVEYIGPLSQIQRRAFKANGIMASLEALAPVIQIAPDAMDKVDFDVVAEEIMNANGMPKRAMRPDDQVKKIRDIKAQKMAEQEAVAKAMAAADAAPKISQAPQPGSPMEQIMKGG